MIIAVDFDGTLCEDKYPDIGLEKIPTLNWVKQQKAAGHKIILWTCRCGEKLEAAVEWCWEHGIIFDEINANLKDHMKKYSTDCRKIYADIYIDDKNMILPWMYSKGEEGNFWLQNN